MRWLAPALVAILLSFSAAAAPVADRDLIQGTLVEAEVVATVGPHRLTAVCEIGSVWAGDKSASAGTLVVAQKLEGGLSDGVMRLHPPLAPGEKCIWLVEPAEEQPSIWRRVPCEFVALPARQSDKEAYETARKWSEAVVGVISAPHDDRAARLTECLQSPNVAVQRWAGRVLLRTQGAGATNAFRKCIADGHASVLVEAELDAGLSDIDQAAWVKSDARKAMLCRWADQKLDTPVLDGLLIRWVDAMHVGCISFEDFMSIVEKGYSKIPTATLVRQMCVEFARSTGSEAAILKRYLISVPDMTPDPSLRRLATEALEKTKGTSLISP